MTGGKGARKRDHCGKNSLRRGYTTGTCAALAARGAALWLLEGRFPETVTILLPGGEPVTMPVHAVYRDTSAAECYVIKDAGDDPDVTNGMAVHARVEPAAFPGVVIDGGQGVGRVTKPGLPVAVGEAAINPVPRAMIAGALADLVPPGGGWRVAVSVPGGAGISGRTFNPRLGITGGISILGTTGYVEPRSLDALRRSLPPLLDILHAAGCREVCLVPGNIGRRAARRLLPPPAEEQIVEVSDFLGFMLDEASRRGFTRIVLVGHPGKLAKVLNGDWQTHAKYARPANGAVIEFCAAAGLPENLLRRLRELPTVEAIQQVLLNEGYGRLLGMLAGTIRVLVRERLGPEPYVAVHLCDLQGNIVGEAL
ncbi:MAG: cobalt-precorrin-5B (C(1))-methyltransferase CbiD [Thermoanaerobacterales bacterium]|nr:cobalt-precorrin-5B (C(1))-methyltransferase CbiD [Thermoanaerobacterales bacterium]